MHSPVNLLKKDYAYWDLDHALWKGTDYIENGLNKEKHRQILKSHTPKQTFIERDGINLKSMYDLLSISDLIYVIRDGRDVLVSYYNYIKHFDGLSSTFGEFLKMKIRNAEVNPVQYWVNHIEDWCSSENVLVVRFDEILKCQKTILKNISKHCGLSINNKKIEPIKMVHNRYLRLFLRLIGRQQSSAVLSGQGISGKYINYFREEDKSYFKKYAGDALIKFGFEEDYHW